MSLAQRHDNSRSSGSEDNHSDTELQSDSVKQAATSRLSIPQFHCIVSEFSEFKQWLLEEIGFAAVLKIPLLSKINLKFSTWLLSKVSVFNRAIIISDSRILKFSSDDVHKVFGIPAGAQPISGAPPTTMSQDTINQIRACIGLTDKDAHSMKVVENFLRKDISADSTTFEKHCFQIAFVIFVMGHILAPTSKHDYASVDYWGSLGSSHTIANYNWCEYVMKYLLDGVEKVKDDLTNNNPVTHMIGCHLFLQIFYLDNLDLGPLNRRHSLMPRIADFNAESIRKMINMCAAKGDSSFDRANLRSPRTVCYTRYIHDCLPDSSEERTYRKRGIWHPNRTHNKNVPKLRSTKSWIETNQSPTCLFLGPSDFSAYLSTEHPILNNDPLSWMLKEHNAICFRNQNSLRNLQHQEDIRFAEKLISSLADRCICCSMRGHDNCILRTSEQQNDDSFRTPIGRTRPLFSGDASSSSTNRTARNVRYSMDHEYADDCAQSSSCALKAPRSARMEANIEHDSMPSFDLGFDDPVPLLPQKSRLYTQRGEGIVAEDSLEAITAMNQCWAENILGNIMLLHEDQPDNCSVVLFRQQIDSTPAKKSIKSPFIATAVDSFTSTLPFAAKIINFTTLQ